MCDRHINRHMTADARPTRSLLGFVALAFALAMSPEQTPPTPSGRPISLRVEVASNVFFARVTVNDVGPLWFTVDTGATLTVIDPAAAKRAKLVVRDAGRRANVGIASGDMAMSTTSGARIAVAGLPVFAPATLYIVEVQNNASYLGHTIDGVLGTDFLSRHIVEFDYSAARVSVLPPRRTDPPGRQGAVSFTLEGNLLVAPATITLPDDQARDGSAAIDTGSNGALTLTSPFVHRHDWSRASQSARPTPPSASTGRSSRPSSRCRPYAFGGAVISAQTPLSRVRRPVSTPAQTSTASSARSCSGSSR